VLAAVSLPPPARLAWSVWGLGALLYLIGFFHRVAPGVMADRLMAEFAIGGAALGNLSGFYFYAYVAMQVPTGLIADRFGPRRLLIGGAALATLGTVVFAWAPTLPWASFGRLLIGGSVAVAFVSMLKLATHWFAPRQFALASGMALFVGIIGGVFGGVPLRALVDAFGWRPVMLVTAGLTVVLTAAIWAHVRDDPAGRGFASYRPPTAGHHHGSVFAALVEVLSYRNTWCLLIAPIGVAGAILTFGGLWGVPYLRHVYGLDPKTAAAVTSAVLVAWALGGPLLGTWSERLGRRKPLYLLGCAVCLAAWLTVALVPLPLVALLPVLLLAGFFAGVIIIGFAFNKESLPARLAGTASGVCNMGPLLGGMILQPAVGWILDRHWQGALENGARVYHRAAYDAAFLMIAGWIALSLLLAALSRETWCKVRD
jgi:MFS family permease